MHAFGVEGKGSYGAGLSRALSAQGFRVIEGNRPNRQLRRQRGKNDAVDAEAAARAVLAGQAGASPKSSNGEVEMIRHLKITRDTALKSRTQAMITLKTLLVNAPQPLREQFIAVTGRMTLIRGLAALRPGPLILTTASAKTAMRALARRWLALDGEISHVILRRLRKLAERRDRERQRADQTMAAARNRPRRNHRAGHPGHRHDHQSHPAQMPWLQNPRSRPSCPSLAGRRNPVCLRRCTSRWNPPRPLSPSSAASARSPRRAARRPAIASAEAETGARTPPSTG